VLKCADGRRDNWLKAAYLIYGEFLRQGGRTNPRWIKENPAFSDQSKGRVSDMVRVIELFRLLSPTGLGYTRAELEGTVVNRLRVIAAHKYWDWVLAHPDEIKEIVNPSYRITDKALRNYLRDEIRKWKVPVI
jgi:hypothetical protein